MTERVQDMEADVKLPWSCWAAGDWPWTHRDLGDSVCPQPEWGCQGCGQAWSVIEGSLPLSMSSMPTVPACMSSAFPIVFPSLLEGWELEPRPEPRGRRALFLGCCFLLRAAPWSQKHFVRSWPPQGTAPLN